MRSKEATITYDKDEDQVAAGIEGFNAFGDMMTVHTLSGGDVTKYEEVFQVPWSLAFVSRQIKAMEYNFRLRYQQVIKNKNNP